MQGHFRFNDFFSRFPVSKMHCSVEQAGRHIMLAFNYSIFFVFKIIIDVFAILTNIIVAISLDRFVFSFVTHFECSFI